MRTCHRPVSKERLCPVCSGDHKCGMGDDGSIQCSRELMEN